MLSASLSATFWLFATLAGGVAALAFVRRELRP